MAVRITHLTRIAGLTGVALAFGASAAPARPVALWSCHGPLGQPLGTTGLTATATGDGASVATAAACHDATGLVATFTRADPAGGSSATWRADAPASATLQAVRAVRTITTASPPYGDGVPQRSVVRAGDTLLETINLLDVWATPPATVSAPAGGTSATAGVDCPRPAGERCAAAAPGALGLGALVLDVDDPSAPSGAVAGLRSPVRGTLDLTVDSADDGAGLASAQALVDGTPLASVTLGAGCTGLDGGTAAEPAVPLGACPARVTGVALALDLGATAVGIHRLQVRVADAAGNVADLYDGELVVAGPDPEQTPSVILAVGDPRPTATTATTAGAGTAATPAGRVPACPHPQLSMALDQRPLRVAHGRPVLLAYARYRFRGRLTCRASGAARRGAPRGVVVDLLNRVGRRTFGRTGAATATGGRVTMILAYGSSRTLIFRHRAATGTSRVRIPITVARRRAR